MDAGYGADWREAMLHERYRMLRRPYVGVLPMHIVFFNKNRNEPLDPNALRLDKAFAANVWGWHLDGRQDGTQG